MAKRQAAERVPYPTTETDARGMAGSGPRLVESQEPSQAAAEKAVEWKQAAGEKIDELKERGARAMSEAQESVSEAYEQVKAAASDRLAEVRDTSAELAHRARIRTRNVIENYPLHVLAGIAGVAFLAGVLLRIWRSNNHE